MPEFLMLGLGLFLGVIWSFSHVTENQWSQANNLCDSNGGLTRYVSNTVGEPQITCKNGAKFTLKEIK